VTLDDLAVVFLVWREDPALLARHHEAVAAALPAGWAGRALLVENDAAPATTRAARELVARCYPHARREVLREPRNAGWGRAMNRALAHATEPLACLLNSDGRPAPGMFATLLQALEDHPAAIAAAPGIHGPGEPDHPPGPPYPERELHGMALMLRRERFLATGAFDPAFFFYGEDHDASRRLRERAELLLRVPDARFDHGKGGRSTRASVLREWRFARGDQLRVAVERPLPVALTRLARARPRAIAEHVAGRDLAGAAAIAAATPFLPAALAQGARRRARPWDGPQLRAWLAAQPLVTAERL
jgi:GT2 family glycosyltransferase